MEFFIREVDKNSIISKVYDIKTFKGKLFYDKEIPSSSVKSIKQH